MIAAVICRLQVSSRVVGVSGTGSVGGREERPLGPSGVGIAVVAGVDEREALSEKRPAQGMERLLLGAIRDRRPSAGAAGGNELDEEHNRDRHPEL